MTNLIIGIVIGVLAVGYFIQRQQIADLKRELKEMKKKE
jgi:uncharacterized membrane-anchored protein YhcB (DUF1043 family)